MFEYLSSRRWLRKLWFARNKSPGYLHEYNLSGELVYLTRNSNNIKHIFCRSEYFANSFFPYTIKEWDKLSLEIRNSVSYSIFKKSLLKFLKTIPNSALNVADIYGIKVLTRLCVDLGHIREHKFRHNFQDTISPLLQSRNRINFPFFSALPNLMTPRTNLMKELHNINSNIFNLDEIFLTKLLLQ